MNKLNISSSSQVGCVRNNNEDMILVVDKFLRNDTYEINLTDTDKDRFVIGLADGMVLCIEQCYLALIIGAKTAQEGAER